MKLIQRGAVRIDATAPHAECPAVAFRNPADQAVLIVINLHNNDRTVPLSVEDASGPRSLAPRSVSALSGTRSEPRFSEHHCSVAFQFEIAGFDTLPSRSSRAGWAESWWIGWELVSTPVPI